MTFSNSVGPLHAAGICANRTALKACITQAQRAIRAHCNTLLNLIIYFPSALHRSRDAADPLQAGCYYREIMRLGLFGERISFNIIFWAGLMTFSLSSIQPAHAQGVATGGTA